MTDPYFGRSTASQDYMVSLAGWGLNNPDVGYWDTKRSDPGLLRDDLMAARAICAGRIGLVRMCLTDFGFDILRWRDYLLSGSDPGDRPGRPGYGRHSYAHPYAFALIDAVVLQGAANPDRPRQLALAERIMPEVLDCRLAWYQRAWRDPDEPLWLAAVEGWPFDPRP